MNIRKFSTLALYSLAGVFSSLAQDVIIPDSLLDKREKITMPLLSDSLKLQQTKLITPLFPPPENQRIEPVSMQQSVSNHLKSNGNDTIKEPLLILHPPFEPHAFFNIGASRWTMPVIGDITTFSPTLNYQVTNNLKFYGGVSFSQYHNLSYIQSYLAPNWSVKSNIIANGFVGAEYRLFDRVLLHGSYQRSLYNQLPNNLMMFAPGHNMVVAGASIDIWNGLGVTVDHVWEFDRYGKMREGFRFSPFIDLPKFLKFLKQ